MSKDHPLIQKILNLVEYDPMYENMGFPDMSALYLSDVSIHEIQQEFEKYFESDDLFEVVMALLQLAAAFDKESHKAVAISILEIAVTANDALTKRMKSD